jgi:exosortase C (VPDSG-CTERM-specific)
MRHIGSLPDVASRPVHEPVDCPRRPLRSFTIAAVVIVAFFSVTLFHWAQFTIAKERNTYLILVPFISAYLIRTRRRELQYQFARSTGFAVIPAFVGAIAIICVATASLPLDRLSLQVFALFNFLLAAAFFFLGNGFLRQITFPIAFLIFAVPVPSLVGDNIEVFLQHTSAEAAYWMMSMLGIPMIRDGINFRLPNVYIQVAQECSGYNSTFSLFMVSLVAGYLYLKSGAKRTALTVAVIPLAILRNGFRVTTLASLSVYDDPKWLDSPLHHSGGPIFFALSLVPFIGLLWWLRKIEIAKDRTAKLP